MRAYWSSLRGSILLLVLLAIVPLFILNIYTGLDQRRAWAIEEQENNLRLVRLASANQERLIEGARQFLPIVAQVPEVRGPDPVACSTFLAGLLKRYPQYINLVVIAPTGDVFCSAVPSSGRVNAADRTYFQRALRTKEFAVSDYLIGRITHKATVAFVYPVLDKTGRVQAVMVAAMDLHWLDELAANARLPEGAALTVIDRSGTILTRYPDPEKWVGQSMKGTPVIDETLNHPSGGTARAAGVDGVARLYAFAPLGDTPVGAHAYVIVGIPETAAFAWINRTLAVNLTGLLLVAMFALAGAWMLADRLVLRKANALVHVTRRLSTGDLAVRTGLPHENGEMSELARTFDEMAETLQRRKTEADEAEGALRRSANRLEMLHNIDRDILTAQSLEAVTAAALRHISKLVAFGRASFLLYDFETNEAQALARVTGNSKVEPSIRFPLKALGDISDMLNVLRQGKDYKVDLASLSQELPAIQVAVAEGIRTMYAVPLIVEGKLIGALNLGLSSTDVPRSEDIEIAREVADQVAIAIQQSELRQNLQRHAAELEQRVASRTSELHEATRFLEHLVATTPGVIYCRRPGDLAMTYVSGNVERALGYRPEEIVGIPRFWYQRIHPDDRGRLDADNEAAWAARRPQVEREYRFLHRDGEYRWLQSVVRFEYDEAGTLVNILGFVLDVTARKQAMEELAQTSNELRKARDFLERLIALSPSLIFEANLRTGYATYVSPNHEQFLGYTKEEILGVPGFWVDHIHPEDREDRRGFSATLAEAAKRKASRLNQEYRFLHKDGSYRWLHATVRIQYDDEGEPVTVFGYSEDTTPRKAAEEALRQAQLEADRANQAKSEFLSRMSHELRTPLNAILGFSQLLEMGNPSPQQRERVMQILKAGRHLLDLINEVLDIARIEAGRMTLSPEAVRVSDALREALDLVRPLAAQRNCSLGEDGSQASSRYVLADRQRLKQVLLNLLSNAVKYNREGGTVTVACENVAPGRLRIKVIDTGRGIPPDRVHQLFTPFMRLHLESAEIEGTGLGLALSKHLVEAMGGTLGVESTVGEGSTFWIDLPLAEAPIEHLRRLQHAGIVRVPAEMQGNGEKKTILYIEDNLSNVSLIEDILSNRPSVRLLTAIQGRMGLDLAREHHPDLVLLDLHLPDIPGGEVLRQLQENPKTHDIPVVVITADATPGQAQRLAAAGCRAYLTKPLDVMKLLAVLDETLENGAG